MRSLRWEGSRHAFCSRGRRREGRSGEIQRLYRDTRGYFPLSSLQIPTLHRAFSTVTREWHRKSRGASQNESTFIMRAACMQVIETPKIFDDIPFYRTVWQR